MASSDVEEETHYSEEDAPRDYVSEEEEEEEEEDDEEEERVRPKKRSRREGRNQFLDVEASVDEDEEEYDEDEDGLLNNDGFIQENDEELELDTDAHRANDDRLHREVDRRRDAIVEQDAEKLASEYRAKYGRSTQSKYRGETGVVPQRLLLPSVQDPNIWGVRCKPGKEKELIRLILKKKFSLQNTPTPLEIYSAFQRDGFSGYIYIEARKQAAITHAVKGFANVYTQNMILVPIKEYSDLLRVNKSKEQELTPGTYVRIKRGKYQGDLAVVENLLENGLEARLKIVPRLDYGKAALLFAASNQDGKRKRPAYSNSAKNRPPPRLFSENDAIQHDQGNLQRRGPKYFFYQNEEYENGYLLKDYKLTYLITDNVRPTLEELSRFNNALEEGIDLNSLSMTLKQETKNATFNNGEHVEITTGEQAGIQGRVISTQGGIVTIVATSGELKGQNLEIPSDNLRKKFSVGDHVRVVGGNYSGDTGMVVNVSKDNVVILSDLSKQELTVFSRDLKEASDIGGANILGTFELHDLVQLNAQTVGCIVQIERDSVGVLGQDGNLRKLTPAQITMKLKDMRNSFATDRNGQEIRIGDTVRELHGDKREGVILHIYRSTLFLHNKDRMENLGVFVSSIGSVTTIQVKGERFASDKNKVATDTFKTPRLPVARSGGRDRIIGQLVTIGNGSQYKGMKGIVKDTTDTTARIELEVKNKVVTVQKEKLLFNDNSSGQTISYTEFVVPKRILAAAGHRGPSSQQGRPWNGGGRTPAWNSGGRTPAWNSGGNKTLAWGSGGNRTPAWNTSSGNRTPAWNNNPGNRTPAWNSGSRTPAYNSGNRTPAWNAGSRTPSAQNSGNRTPAWNTGAQTPSWNAGGQTPSWNAGSSSSNNNRSQTWYSSAPTPASAPTPGVYESAPTPGAVYEAKTPVAAPTPGAWNDGETPRYEPDTP